MYKLYKRIVTEKESKIGWKCLIIGPLVFTEGYRYHEIAFLSPSLDKNDGISTHWDVKEYSPSFFDGLSEEYKLLKIADNCERLFEMG